MSDGLPHNLRKNSSHFQVLKFHQIRHNVRNRAKLLRVNKTGNRFPFLVAQEEKHIIMNMEQCSI